MLIHAADKAKAQKSAEVQPRHLFAAILDETESETYKWLKEALEPKLPLWWVSRVLEKIPPDTVIDVTEISRRFEAESPADAKSAFSDAASVEDKLGFETHARALARTILRPDTRPPVVIGVYGPWGSGKSTFLKLVQRYLAEEHDRISKEKPSTPLPDQLLIEYNAWEYIDATKLWAGLAQVVSKRLDDKLRWWQRLLYAARRRTRRFIGAILIGLIPVAGAGVIAIWGDFSKYIVDPFLQGTARLILSGLGTSLSALIISQQRPLTANVNDLTKQFDPKEMTVVP